MKTEKVTWAIDSTPNIIWSKNGNITYYPPVYSFIDVYGYSTPEEQVAYQDGYYQSQEVIKKWIEKWEGGTNSEMGKILHKKFEELKDKL